MKKLFLVCNAHMDPVWQWRWQEGLGAALSTFRVAADFCEKYGDFVFCHNEALLYEWTEEHDPELFARIKKLVAAGRWKIMGGWYLQPDCNLPQGESIVRQILTGYRYFHEKFGLRVSTAVSLDCFGHSKGLVQILRKAGYDGYLFMRPDPGTGLLDDLPQAFLWEGYAGQSVKAFRINTPYNTLFGHAAESVSAYADEKLREEGDCFLRLWGIGDHGGGPSEVDLQAINRLIRERADEMEMVHSDPDSFMETLDEKKLPVFSRDLNPIDAGVYTSMHRVKSLHRRLEARLLTCEKVSSVCEIAGLVPYPVEELQSAWKDLLFCEFHDILPGTSVKAAEEDSVLRLSHGLETAERILTKDLYAMARREKMPKNGDIPILVLNPHPYPVTDIFDCEFMLADQNWSDNFTAGTVYCGETPLPSQMEKEGSSMNLDWRKRVVFRATLAPLSLNRFDCRLFLLPEKPFRIRDLTGEKNVIFRTDEMTCTFDAQTGTFLSVNASGKTFPCRGLGELQVFRDTCDPWLINGKAIPDYEGSFRLMTEEEATRFAGSETPRVSAVRVVEDGPVRTVIEVLKQYGESKARILFLIPKQGCELRAEITVFWNEHDRMLRWSVPHGFSDAIYTGQDMFGTKSLTKEYENVAGRWILAKSPSEGLGVAVLNDSTYGSMLTESEMRISMLRAPTYTSHKINDRLRLPLERYYSRMDQGEHVFSFGVLFGTAAELKDSVDLRAQTFQEFPAAVSAFCAGEDGKRIPAVVAEGVRLDTLKKAEDGDGYIARLYNPKDRETEGTLLAEGLSAEYRGTLGPNEFVTVRLEEGKAAEADLLTERAIR